MKALDKQEQWLSSTLQRLLVEPKWRRSALDTSPRTLPEIAHSSISCHCDVHEFMRRVVARDGIGVARRVETPEPLTRRSSSASLRSTVPSASDMKSTLEDPLCEASSNTDGVAETSGHSAPIMAQQNSERDMRLEFQRAVNAFDEKLREVARELRAEMGEARKDVLTECHGPQLQQKLRDIEAAVERSYSECLSAVKDDVGGIDRRLTEAIARLAAVTSTDIQSLRAELNTNMDAWDAKSSERAMRMSGTLETRQAELRSEIQMSLADVRAEIAGNANTSARLIEEQYIDINKAMQALEQRLDVQARELREFHDQHSQESGRIVGLMEALGQRHDQAGLRDECQAKVGLECIRSELGPDAGLRYTMEDRFAQVSSLIDRVQEDAREQTRVLEQVQKATRLQDGELRDAVSKLERLEGCVTNELMMATAQTQEMFASFGRQYDQGQADLREDIQNELKTLGRHAEELSLDGLRLHVEAVHQEQRDRLTTELLVMEQCQTATAQTVASAMSAIGRLTAEVEALGNELRSGQAECREQGEQGQGRFLESEISADHRAYLDEKLASLAGSLKELELECVQLREKQDLMQIHQEETRVELQVQLECQEQDLKMECFDVDLLLRSHLEQLCSQLSSGLQEQLHSLTGPCGDLKLEGAGSEPEPVCWAQCVQELCDQFVPLEGHEMLRDQKEDVPSALEQVSGWTEEPTAGEQLGHRAGALATARQECQDQSATEELAHPSLPEQRVNVQAKLGRLEQWLREQHIGVDDVQRPVCEQDTAAPAGLVGLRDLALQDRGKRASGPKSSSVRRRRQKRGRRLS